MASSIDNVFGDASSRPVRVVVATVDLTLLTSYVAGGHEDATLKAEIDKLGVDGYRSLPFPHYDGAETRYFQVDPATGKLVAYDDAALATETTATDDMSGHTAVPVVLIGE